MDYFTLERMALETARNAHSVLGGRVEKTTVRVQNPSALIFARYPGVDITRKVTDFQISCVLTCASMLIRAATVDSKTACRIWMLLSNQIVVVSCSTDMSDVSSS